MVVYENDNLPIEQATGITLLDDNFASSITIANAFEKIPEETDTSISNNPYSIFTSKGKAFIVAIAATSGFFSPFSTNIYFPALNKIQKVNILNYIYIYMFISFLTTCFFRT
jgi:hypothetical protein